MLGDYPSARRYAEIVAKIYIQLQQGNPDNASLFLQTGLCYLIMNDLTNAEGEFKNILIEQTVKEKQRPFPNWKI